MVLKGAWLRAASLLPGSLNLILARWLLGIVAMLPGTWAGIDALASGPAAQPYFSDAPQPFPLLVFIEFLGRSPGSMWGSLALGAVVAWLGNQLLTAGAARILDRRSPPPRVWRTTIDVGRQYLGRYLRVAAFAAVWVLIAILLTNRAFEWLADRGTLAGWSAQTLLLTLPVTRALVLVAIASAVGTAALWCRVIVVHDQRRCVRRLHQVVPRLARRAPVRGFVLSMLLSALSLVVAALVVLAWRQSGAGALGVWLPLWLAVLLGQAYVWHWRIRACIELADAGLATAWSAVPDTPWHVFRRLSQFVGARYLNTLSKSKL
jgi:hypothetical protein